MNSTLIFSIIELAVGIAKGTAGTNNTAQTAITDALALEQIAKHVAQSYQELTGKPIDVSLLVYEEPMA